LFYGQQRQQQQRALMPPIWIPFFPITVPCPVAALIEINSPAAVHPKNMQQWIASPQTLETPIGPICCATPVARLIFASTEPLDESNAP
jgi:hypothetical protein